MYCKISPSGSDGCRGGNVLQQNSPSSSQWLAKANCPTNKHTMIYIFILKWLVQAIWGNLNVIVLLSCNPSPLSITSQCHNMKITQWQSSLLYNTRCVHVRSELKLILSSLHGNLMGAKHTHLPTCMASQLVDMLSWTQRKHSEHWIPVSWTCFLTFIASMIGLSMHVACCADSAKAKRHLTRPLPL